MKKLVIFVVCCFMGCLNVLAAENDSQVQYEFIDNIYSNRQIGEELYTGEQGIVLVNGKLAYCLDATLILKENIYSSSEDFSLHNIDENTLNYLEMVSHFGYGYEGRTDKKYYLAAQEIIWEYLSGGEVYWTDGEGGEVLDISYYKSDILTSINEYSLLTPNIPTYMETYQNEDIILEDNNNVLKYYKSDLWLGTISGNTLTLSAEFKGTTTITLTKQPLSYMTSYIYYCEGSQTLATFGYSNEETETIEIRYKVKNLSKVALLSKDSYSGKTIVNKETKIRIYDITRNEYIVENGSDILTINETGRLELETLFEEGEYRVEEVAVPTGYKKLTSEYTFNIYEYDGPVKTVSIYSDPMRYDINLTTKLEKYIGIEETIDGIEGIYGFESANDVIYGLYAAENIYDAGGELLYEKDILISELTVDNGKVMYFGLSYGNYYLQELNVPDEYELDNSKVELSLTNDEYTVYLNFIKYLRKGNITIRKVNNDIGLRDAEFKFYGEKYVNEVKIKSNALGYIVIENIPNDLYHLIETKAPIGYILEPEEKEFLLYDTNITYDFHNEKEIILVPDIPEDTETPILPEDSEVKEETEMPDDSYIPEESEGEEKPTVSDDPVIPENPVEPEIPAKPELEDEQIPDDSETSEENQPSPIIPESPTESEKTEIDEQTKIPGKIEEPIEEDNNIVENPSTYIGLRNQYVLNILICILFLQSLKIYINKI